MLDFVSVKMNDVALSYVGNKVRGENVQIPEKPLDIDNAVSAWLMQYFLGYISEDKYYQIKDQEVKAIVDKFFDKNSDFMQNVSEITKKLYESCDHPKIKAGDFFVAKFEDIAVDGEIVDAIGFFKVEHKADYFKTKDLRVIVDEGFNKKIDKAALVYNTFKETGYKVSVIDCTNAQEARYWREDFLGLEDFRDEYFQTSQFMDCCSGFANDVYCGKNNVDFPEQAKLKNNILSYMGTSDCFNYNEFKNDVLVNPDVQKAFDDYMVEKIGPEQPEDFIINKKSFKANKKKFKSVLKLDKNFHVYIHGTNALVEKGVDPETGMKYYKLFFNEEA